MASGQGTLIDWTPDKLAALAPFVDDGEILREKLAWELAGKLGCSPHTIRAKVKALRYDRAHERANTQRWTYDEEALSVRLEPFVRRYRNLRACDANDIAREFGCSAITVRARLQTLRRLRDYHVGSPKHAPACATEQPIKERKCSVCRKPHRPKSPFLFTCEGCRRP